MDCGRGGQETINHGHVANGVHSAPSIGDGGIDR